MAGTRVAVSDTPSHYAALRMLTASGRSSVIRRHVVATVRRSCVGSPGRRCPAQVLEGPHMRSRVRSFFALFGVLMLGATALVALAPAAVADTIGPVDASIPDGDPGSLRDVLNNANEGDTVLLQAGATYQLTDCELGALSNGALNVTGNGAVIEQTCDTYVWNQSGDLILDGVTLTGGFDIGNRPGGAIHMDGDSLTILNSSIVGNQTCGDGGAIFMHTEGAG